MPSPIVAFIARSFSKLDEERIQPIVDHLNTFAPFGFVCRSAEPAEAERVSDKVQRLIRDSDLFVGLFTRRYRVHQEDEVPDETGQYGASPTKWIPPSWILQESGYAVALGKKLVLFKEIGVELPELHGDLEYIEFDPGNLSDAFRRANEMVGGIIAKGLAIEVQTTVTQEIRSPAAQGSSVAQEETQPESDSGSYWLEFVKALDERDEAKIKEAYERGLKHMTENAPGRVLFWKTLTARWKFEQGYPEGWQELQTLRVDSPSEWEIDVAIAECLRTSGDLAESAGMYATAADKAPPVDKPRLLTRAAQILHEDKQWDKARQVLLEALETADPQQRLPALRALYQNFKSAQKTFEAFGVGESCIAENSAQPDFHFTLGYD